MTEENILTYYGRAALSRWWLLLGIIALCTIGAWSFSTFVLAQDPVYDASVSLNVVPTSEELGYANQFARGQTTEGGLILLQTYAEYARARETRAEVVDRFVRMNAKAAGMSETRWLASQQGPPGFSPGRIWALLNYGSAPELPPREKMTKDLGEGTLIESIDGTYMMQLTVSWDDPRGAAWFANALADTVVARAQSLSRQSGQQLSGVLQDELDRKTDQLSQLKNASRELKIGLGVVDIDRQKQSLLDAQAGRAGRAHHRPRRRAGGDRAGQFAAEPVDRQAGHHAARDRTAAGAAKAAGGPPRASRSAFASGAST